MRQDDFTPYGSVTISTSGGGDFAANGAAFLTYQVLTVASTPQVKAYGKIKSGNWKTIPYQKRTAAGVLSFIAADTASGALIADDKIIVPNEGYTDIRVIATTGSLTASLTLNPEGGHESMLLQELITLNAVDNAVLDTINAFLSLINDSLNGIGALAVDSYNTAKIDAAAGASTLIIADPGDNKQIWIYGLYGMADTGAGTVVFEDGAGLDLSGTMAVSDEGGWVLPISGNLQMPWIKCTTSEAFHILTVTCTFDGVIAYGIVSV